MTIVVSQKYIKSLLKVHSPNNPLRKTNMVAAVCASMFLSTQSMAADSPYDDWQVKRLFQPTIKQIESEQKGQVFIYDGMTDKLIEQAMEKQFERVQSMMFVRTVVTSDKGEPQRDPETGEDMIESDGCD